jgi:hypothetical protein
MLLPFLPSLLPRSARAQSMTPPKRFIYLGVEHGGASFANMYGTQGTMGMTPVQIWSGNTANYAPLVPTTSGMTTSISPLLSAASSVLTPTLAAKLNLLRGVDFVNTLIHHDGGHLGNNHSQVTSSAAAALSPMVTIDQVMAYSPNFYGTQIPRARSINIGGDRQLSWTYSNPSTLTGSQALPTFNSSLKLFTSIFGTGSTTTTTTTRPLIIDRVIQNYNSLRNSNRRLSAADKQRLDDHVARLTQLEMSIGASSTPLSCGSPTPPADNAKTWPLLDNTGLALDQQVTYYKLMCDVIVAAFACGATRIAVFHDEMPMTTYQGDWHQDIAHQDTSAGPQMTLEANYQQVFEHIFLYLASSLDAITDVDGSSTILDNTLLYWSMEAGYHTHDPYQVPIVMAGSAGGYFKTGLFVDYRNLIPTCQNIDSSHNLMPDNYAGLIYSQFLATALYSMGITSSEWKQPNGLPGYGDYKNDPDPDFRFRNSDMNSSRNPNVIMNASMPMPIITKG